MLAGPCRKLAGCAAAGFGGGACIGLVGWGGAQFIIPSLTHPAIAMSQLAAAGTSLCSMSTSAAMTGSTMLMNGAADLPTTCAIALPAIASARYGVRFASRLNADVHQLIFNGFNAVMLPTHVRCAAAPSSLSLSLSLYTHTHTWRCPASTPALRAHTPCILLSLSLA